MARPPRSLGLFLFAAALLFSSCSSSATTSVVAPSADKCAVSIATSATSFPATGGSGSVTVSTARDCTWSLASDAPWLSLTGANAGQGDAVVAFGVAANPLPSPRTGGIAAGPDRQVVSQAGAPCRVSLSRTGDSVSATGGALSVFVSTLSGCAWSAVSNASWVAVTSGGSGNASGTVALTVSANSGGARVGDVNIAGQTYTVSQTAVAPPPPDGGSGGGGGTGGATVVQVTGSVSDISGRCPALTFAVNDTAVSTSAATIFTGGSCTDIKKKADVSVTGVGPGSTIAAQTVTLLTGHGNH